MKQRLDFIAFGLKCAFEKPSFGGPCSLDPSPYCSIPPRLPGIYVPNGGVGRSGRSSIRIEPKLEIAAVHLLANEPESSSRRWWSPNTELRWNI